MAIDQCVKSTMGEPVGQVKASTKVQHDNGSPHHDAGSRHIWFVIVAMSIAVIGVAIGVVGVDLFRAWLPELARCGTMTFTKLAGSMDDVVWFMPFMCGTAAMKAKHGAVYMGLFAIEVCLCTAITSSFAYLVQLMLPASFAAAGLGVTSIMQLAAGCMLAFYAIKLHLEQDGEDADGESDEPKSVLGIKDLLVIGVLGSLDDMCLQASTLASGAVAFRHMMIGVLIGCSIVVAICWGASQLQCVLKTAAAIPLWSVVAGLSLCTFISAFVG